MTDFNKDFAHKEVEQLCKERNRKMEDFYSFMRGQTMSLDDKRDPVYRGRDARKFFCGNATFSEVLTYMAENEC